MNMGNNLNNSWMVSVLCFTYNHSPFIEKTMQGFCSQQTSFPIVYCIIDDASTDSEPQIIRNFLRGNFSDCDSSIARKEETADYSMFFGQHKSNENCFFSVYFLKRNHFGTSELRNRKLQYVAEWFDNSKYIAYCEGDDYWTVPYKIEKQVKLLEANPSASLVATGYINMLNDKEIDKTIRIGNQDFFFFDLNDWCRKYYTKYLTVLRRSDASSEYDKKRSKFKYDRDVHLFYYLLKWGKGIYVSEPMGVYNYHQGSFYSSNSRGQNAYTAYLCYKELLDSEPEDGVLRYLLFTSICLRLKYPLPAYKSIAVLNEGLNISKSYKEKCKLLYCFLKGVVCQYLVNNTFNRLKNQ